MSITSLKLREELREHSADSVEQRSQFVAQAQAARAAMLQTGQGYDTDDVRNYLRQRLADKQTTKPQTRFAVGVPSST
ncbi:hypothetical protein [Duganella sp. BuS-21]|uniref:hypothetical protein n=1 Tax=Duganella sp. BuS-21 TaxID=2943848 RepID=UPI0035A7312A